VAAPVVAPVAERPHKLTVDGTTWELTDDELAQAATEGIQSLNAKQAARAAAKPVTLAPIVEPELPTTAEERIKVLEDRLDGKIKTDRNQTIMGGIESVLGGSQITDPGDRHDVERLIMAEVSLAMKNNSKEMPNVAALAKPILERHNARVSRGAVPAPTTDVAAKLEQQKALATGTTSGVNAGVVKPAPLTRKSFRDGSLAKSVYATYKQASDANVGSG